MQSVIVMVPRILGRRFINWCCSRRGTVSSGRGIAMKTVALVLLNLLLNSHLFIQFTQCSAVATGKEELQESLRDEAIQDKLLSKISILIKQHLSEVLNDALTVQNTIIDAGSQLAATVEVVERLTRVLIAAIPPEEKNQGFFRAVYSQDLEMIQSFQAAGMDMNARDPDNAGRTALHKAAEKNHPETVQLLLDLKAQVDPVAPYSRETPLMTAARKGNTDIARILVKAGANVNAIAEGETPLSRAVKNDLKDLTRLLLDSRANVEYRDRQNRSLLHIAAESNAVAVMPVLIEAKVDLNAEDQGGNTPLHLTALSDHAQATEILLKEHAEVDPVNAEGKTPLYVALENNATEVARLLIAAKAKVDHQVGPNMPLIYLAVKTDSIELVRLLINAGANLSASGLVRGDSPLHLAVNNDNSAMVELLIETKADVNRQTMQGATPLHVAASRNNEIIVKTLLAAGADKSLKNRFGLTAGDVTDDPALEKLLTVLGP